MTSRFNGVTKTRVIFEIISSEKVQHHLFARSAGDCSAYKFTVYTHEAEEVLV